MSSNPFHVPSDEEVFALRDEEAARKRQEREQAKEQHVWEKGVKKSTTSQLMAEAGLDDVKNDRSLNLVAAATRDRRKEKENMADFIAKKREMFLVQMSLDTKRAEIRKLEERAQQREEALRKSEQMLEEDALRFDQFLKDNDQKAVQAIKKAEAETKAKAEKVQEIKKLNMQITQIKSEMSKFEEQLEDCRKYKEFLDKLTPPEWFEEQEQLRQQRKRARKAAKLKTRQQELNVAAEKEKEALLEMIEAEKAKKGRARSRKDREAEEAAEKARIDAIKPVELTMDDISDDEDSKDEEVPMFFKQPQQLLDIFTALEESNLFLIQNSQETEAALEELKTKFADTRIRMDADSKALEGQIESLKQSIQVEEDKQGLLEQRRGKHKGVKDQEQTLDDLNKKVAEVYRAIFSEADHSLGTLQMLTNIEARLEELLGIIAQMPQAEVEAAERQKEKDRRGQVRKQKQEEQRLLQEARVKRSILRSQEPVKKRTGKPEMFRSVLQVNKKVNKNQNVDKADPADNITYWLGLDVN